MPNGDLIQYVIDGQNRRIARKLNGRITNKWLYAGQLTPVAELDSAGNIIARFSGGYMNKRDTIYQVITDHLGSPRLVINVSNGEIAQRIDYDEFGNVIYDSNPGFQPFGFAGGLYDPDTKLVRFGARDYDAETGRWTNRDPLGFAGRLSNLYEYSICDPVNFVDRIGKQTLQVGVSVDVHIGPFTLAGSFGVAADLNGNVVAYTSSGYGGGGGSGSAGLSLAYTNANSVYDLNGVSNDVSVGGGEGAYGSVDVSTDPNTGAIEGVGVTFGAGEGFEASGTRTTTQIYGIGLDANSSRPSPQPYPTMSVPAVSTATKQPCP